MLIGENKLFKLKWKIDQNGYETGYFRDVEDRLTLSREEAIEMGGIRRLGDHEFEPSEPDKYVQLPLFSGPSFLIDDWLVIFPKGGKGIKEYYPFQDYPGVHRTFAKLELTPEACRDFAEVHGLLDQSYYGEGHYSFWSSRYREPLDYPDRTETSVNTSSWYGLIIVFRHLINLIDDGNRVEAAKLFEGNPHRPKLYPGFEIHGDGRLPTPQFVPETLREAMWIQMMNEIQGIAEFKPCKWMKCTNWIPIGVKPGQTKGVKPGQTRYCSPKCRNAFNNAKNNPKPDEGSEANGDSNNTQLEK